MAVDTFLGTIKMLGFGFVMENYAACDGALMPISTNDALFSLLGTMYGGDGRTNFALPDLRGRVPIQRTDNFHALGTYPQGYRGGLTDVTLSTSEMPSHYHVLQATENPGSQETPADAVLAKELIYTQDDSEPLMELYGGTVGNEGGSQPHTNMMPYLAINFSIAIQGIYPPRH